VRSPTGWTRRWRPWARKPTPAGRPVKVIAIGPGPDADLAALEQVGAATGGAAHSAVDEQDLQTVLVDALRQRS
jgi:hypothetical protein